MSLVTKRIICIFYIFLILWTIIQTILIYHFQWIEFKYNFERAMDNRNIVLFSGIKPTDLSRNNIVHEHISKHTITFNLQYMELYKNKTELISWSEHFHFSKFNVNEVNRAIRKE